MTEQLNFTVENIASFLIDVMLIGFPSFNGQSERTDMLRAAVGKTKSYYIG